MIGRRPPTRNVALVAAGGAIGAVVRVALAAWFPVVEGSFPWTTFVENVAGAFALAFTLSLLAERVAARPEVRLLVCTGALGAFTTYSTLAVEVDRLAAGGHPLTATGYAVTSVVVGLAAALVGLRVGRVWPRSRRSGRGRGTAP